mgnify:CR=1 FL=1
MLSGPVRVEIHDEHGLAFAARAGSVEVAMAAAMDWAKGDIKPEVAAAPEAGYILDGPAFKFMAAGGHPVYLQPLIGGECRLTGSNFRGDKILRGSPGNEKQARKMVRAAAEEMGWEAGKLIFKGRIG